MARPPLRSFSSAMRVLECGPSSQLRRKRTTERRMRWIDGAGAWSPVSHVRSAVQRTFRSAALPGCRSSDGRSGRVPYTPRPSDRWCTPTSACGTPTGGRSHFANVSVFHAGTSVRVLVRAVPIARACRPVRSARSPRRDTTWTVVSPISRNGREPGASARDVWRGTPAPSGARRLRGGLRCGAGGIPHVGIFGREGA